ESQCGGEERKEIGEDFRKGRRRRRRRVKTLAPSSTGATISGATSALFSGDFASTGLACVIRASYVNPVKFLGRNGTKSFTRGGEIAKPSGNCFGGEDKGFGKLSRVAVSFGN
ncbi:hypothetical protein U1Q18_012782, partial [Sarracenia purpurea var. burkii]